MAKQFDRHRLLLFVLIAAYVLVFSKLAFDLHAGMRTHKSDLGQMDQALWNTSRGRFLESIQDDYLSTRLTDHAEPIFIPLSAVLWLWDDVRALLLVQVLFVAIGAWPLYELALRLLAGRAPPGPVLLGQRTLALTLAAAYLLAPPLQSAVLTEFHAIPLAAPLILWAFWAVSAGSWWQFTLAALLLAGVKEEAALLAAGLGVWALWRLAWRPPSLPRSRIGVLLAAAVVIVSLVWFYAATFVIIPTHAVPVHQVAESAYFQRYGALGDSPAGILTNLVTRPGLVAQIAGEPARVRYLLGLLLSFGFLSLLGLDVLFLSLPVLLANLLSAYPAQYYSEFHYTAPLVPYFAAAGAYGVSRLLALVSRTRGPDAPPSRFARAGYLALISWILVWALASYALAGRGPLGGRYDPTPVTAHHRLLARFTAQVPDDASLTATAAVHPHVSHRRYVYQFPYGLQEGQAEWALLDVTTSTDMAPGAVRDTVETMLAEDWGVVDAANGYILLRRGAPAKTLPDSFYDFVRTPGDAAAARGPLSLDGFDLSDWPRWRRTAVTTRWQVGDNFVPEHVRPWLELRSPSGDLLYTFDDLTPPALVWLPPTQWRPGDLIAIETTPLALPQTWGAAAAVVHGRNPFEPNDRVPADTVVPSPVPVSPDGTLALLAAYQRDDNDRLQSLPAAPNAEAAGPASTQQPSTSFAGPGGPIPLMAQVPSQAATGGALDIQLLWPAGIPEGYVPFVHLRDANNATLAQADGPPVWFIPVASTDGPVSDWRQIQIPADVPPGDRLQLFAGLYRLDDGQRLDVLDANGKPAGNEASLGAILITPPPIPDQTCALDPATCP